MKNDLSQARRLIKECLDTQNTYLDLGNCGIIDLNDLPELFECLHLATLVLSDRWWDEYQRKWLTSKNYGIRNRIEKIPHRIMYLNGLKKLFLSRNKIVDGNSLSNLTSLNSLDLRHNKISDLRFLSQLTDLRSLSLSNNGIKDFRILSKLKHLEILFLSSTKIKDFNFLSSLKELKNLSLRSNQISDLSKLPKLTNLQSLSLGRNKIVDIDELQKLPNLQILSLSSNQITQLHSLSELTNLKHLYLRGNKINDISAISQLIGLQGLSLSFNQITDISSLSSLIGLNSLDLGNNQIADINSLSSLTSLNSLDLDNNQITNISSLSSLTSLNSLDISNNEITNIPKFLFEKFPSFKLEKLGSGTLNIYQNPIVNPPVEVLKQGGNSVLDWYGANKKQLEEIKIILIGEPKAGKTSLLKRLKSDVFNENEVQTDGINIESIPFETCEPFKNQTKIHPLTGHFWDFGGQEIMNATHQFFLTNRSVYILVLNARNDTNIATQIRQWLTKIKATGGNSPIIVVSNKIDLNTGFGFENEYELQQEFPQIKYFIKASSKDKTGIEILKERLAELIPEAELFHTEIDERWIDVKKQLQIETKNEHFLNESRFRSICRKHGIRKKDQQKNAINFLHDLGLVLHFENINLSEYFVLDPYWITYGVYQIVTSKYAGEVKGKVPMDKLEYIVNEEQDKEEVYRPSDYKKINYSNNERRFLVDILHEFKLCFYLNNRTHFILPDLLDTQEPISLSRPIRESKESIRFVYQYGYIPKSTMPYIIVETHKIAKVNWRTGCIIENDDSQALIGVYGNRLSITVIGRHKQKREFMSIIRYKIDKINNSLADKPSMLIPLTDSNRFVKYQTLLAMEVRGKTYYEEYEPTYKEYEISKLLDGITNVSELRNMGDKVDKVLNKLLDIENNQNVIIQKLDDHYNYLMQKLGKGDQTGMFLTSIAMLNFQQKEAITTDIEDFLKQAFEATNTNVNAKLNQIYTDLKKSSNLETKIKLGLPLAALTGIDIGLEAKFDVKKWATKMYEKHRVDLLGIVF